MLKNLQKYLTVQRNLKMTLCYNYLSWNTGWERDQGTGKPQVCSELSQGSRDTPGTRSWASPSAICHMDTIPTSERCTWCLWNTSGRSIFIVCLDFGEQPLDFSFVSWMDFSKCVKTFFFSSPGISQLQYLKKWALFNPECWALLDHVCIGNLLPENQFPWREMCHYHCLDVLFCCLEK